MNQIGHERGWSGMTRQQFDALCSSRGALLVGSPEEVLDKILFEHQRLSGPESVGPIPHARVMWTIELLGTVGRPSRSKAARGIGGAWPRAGSQLFARSLYLSDELETARDSFPPARS